MGDRTAEQLSALMDEELDGAELQGLLRQIRDNSEYSEQWQRFHLASEAMRNGLPASIDIGLADRVRTLIDADATRIGPPTRAGKGLLRPRPMIGLAVAASLVAAVTVTLKLGGDSEVTPYSISAELALPHVAIEQGSDETSMTSLFVPANAETEAKIHPYLRNHSEQASRSVAPKILPLGRMVSYEIQR